MKPNDKITKAAAITNAIDLLSEAVRATLVGRGDRARDAIGHAMAVLSEI